MSNSYKLTITLKQHTPLIHFQHNQEGATLRATEVKPKLDRFLLRNLKGKIPSNWQRRTEQGDISLDYKLRINLMEEAKPADNLSQINYEAGEKESNNLVLANMGKKMENPGRKHFIFHQVVGKKMPSHQMTIFSFHSGLRELIEAHIADFFLTHNFGNRQTKGFGSFYLDPGSKGYKEASSDWWFSVNTIHSSEGINIVFDKISLLWKAMRPGINDGVFDRNLGRYKTNTFYFKSLIFMYAKYLGIQWDKKTIKENFFSSELFRQPYTMVGTPATDSPLKYSSPQKYLMKDLLGLSLAEGWGNSYNKAEITKTHIAVDEEVIERFASPIVFKPIFLPDNTCKVYLIIRKIPLKIHDANFKISGGGKPFELAFPDSKVSIEDFFSYLFIKRSNGTYAFDVENQVEKDHRANSKYIDIKDIIQQIRRNYISTNTFNNA